MKHSSKRVYLVCAVLFILNFPLINFDKPLSDWFHLVLMPWDFWLQRLTYIGDGYILTAVLAALTLILIAARTHWWRKSVAALGALALSSLPIQGLKFILGRPRPYVARDTRYHDIDFSKFYWFAGNYDFRSFPSGHSAAIFVVAWVLIRQPKMHWSARALLLTLAVAVCLSRVALAKHFFSDAVAGALIGIMVAELVLNVAGRRLES